MKRCIACAFALALSLGSGCDGSRAGSTHSWGNVPVLTGAPVGLGTESPEQLTRVIPISVSGSDIVGTHAVLGRRSTTQESFRFIAPVTNRGSRHRCFLRTSTFDLLDSAGSVVGTVSGAYVQGKVGKLKGEVMHTATCIGPGETGYLLESPVRSAVESIAGARITLTSSEGEWEAPVAQVVPVSYDAPARDKPFTVTIANQGAIPARVNGLSQTIFFDETDTPAYWGFLYSGSAIANSPHTLAVGETYQLVSGASSELWNGSSTKQLVLLDFDTP